MYFHELFLNYLTIPEGKPLELLPNPLLVDLLEDQTQDHDTCIGIMAIIASFSRLN